MNDPGRDETRDADRPHEGAMPSGTAGGLTATQSASVTRFLPRGVLGGVLMGLANLVPGISGGTMLLAAGVYPAFIDAIAELTRFRLRPWPLLVLGTIAGSALLAILLLAGPTRTLVIEQRPLMYSFFIGLTLGGVPLVWRLARPMTGGVWIGMASAFTLMVVMALEIEVGTGGVASTPLLLLSGLAGASAMILPGISGGYLLLLLGQYEPILGAIDEVKQGLLGEAGLDLARLLASAEIVVPVGVGVVLGVVGVSNGLRWLLERFAKPTLGALLGLLLGAVIGLYPFQSPIETEHAPPQAASEARYDEVVFERYTPSPAELPGPAAALLTGLAITWLIARVGREQED